MTVAIYLKPYKYAQCALQHEVNYKGYTFAKKVSKTLPVCDKREEKEWNFCSVL